MRVKEVIQKSALFRSFQAINRQFIHVLFLDFLYYIVLLFVGFFYVYKILPSFLHMLDVVELLKAGQAFSSVEELISGIGAIQTQWTSFQIWSGIIFLVLFLNYCIFKYLIWKKIQKKHMGIKQDAKNVGAFAILTVSVLLGAILALLMSWYTFVLQYFNLMFFFIVPFAAIYSINLLHPLYIQQQSLKKTYAQFWNIGIKKCYTFLIPYFLILLGLVLVVKILPVFLFLPNTLYFLVYVLAFAVYFSWIKLYFYALLQKQTEKQK